MNQFNIGDLVYTGKIGNSVKGKIICIFDGLTYCVHFGKQALPQLFSYNNNQLIISRNHPWNKYNDEWPKEPVYYIQLDPPDRTVSFHEFCNSNGVNPDSEDAAKIYENTVPIQHIVAHPEYDLSP